jgi:hypothetical protein
MWRNALWVVVALAGCRDFPDALSPCLTDEACAPGVCLPDGRCGQADALVADAQVTDAQVTDAGLDAQVTDAQMTDAQVTDAGFDAQVTDAGGRDAQVTDAGGLDAQVHDALVDDALVDDAAVPDVGVADAGEPTCERPCVGRVDCVLEVGCGAGDEVCTSFEGIQEAIDAAGGAVGEVTLNLCRVAGRFETRGDFLLRPHSGLQIEAHFNHAAVGITHHGGTLRIQDMLLTAGGIGLHVVGGTVEILRSTISGNQLGALVDEGATLRLDDVQVANNGSEEIAERRAAGLEVYGRLAATATRFAENTLVVARDDGVLRAGAVWGDRAELGFTACQFEGNILHTSGGAGASHLALTESILRVAESEPPTSFAQGQLMGEVPGWGADIMLIDVVGQLSGVVQGSVGGAEGRIGAFGAPVFLAGSDERPRAPHLLNLSVGGGDLGFAGVYAESVGFMSAGLVVDQEAYLAQVQMVRARGQQGQVALGQIAAGFYDQAGFHLGVCDANCGPGLPCADAGTCAGACIDGYCGPTP